MVVRKASDFTREYEDRYRSPRFWFPRRSWHSVL